MFGGEFVAVFLPDCLEDFGVGFTRLEPLIEVGVLADALEEFGDEWRIVFGHELPEVLAADFRCDETTVSGCDAYVDQSFGAGAGGEGAGDDEAVPVGDAVSLSAIRRRGAVGRDRIRLLEIDFGAAVGLTGEGDDDDQRSVGDDRALGGVSGLVGPQTPNSGGFDPL